MNRLKKLLAVLMTVATLCSLLPSVAFAEEFAEVPEDMLLDVEETEALPEVPEEDSAEIIVLPEEEILDETADEAVIEEIEIIEDVEDAEEAEEALPEEDILMEEELTEEFPEETEIDGITYRPALYGINPYYKDRVDEDALAAATAALEPTAPVANATYCTTYEQAVAVMRQGLKNRQSTIVVSYKYKDYDDYVWDNIDHFFDDAMAHTGVGDEGDYLMWHWSYWKIASAPEYYDNGYTCCDMQVYFEYYTTAAQEKTVGAKVDSILKSLNIANASDYVKVQKIYKYLCDHVVYDFDHLNDNSYNLQFTAYAALINGTSVCQGYANAFYRMCLTAGVDCREIPSISYECHIWNIVCLDGKYWDLDATWDAGNNPNSYEFFLQSDDAFTRYGEHTRDYDYATSEFYKAYPMGTRTLYWSINKAADVTKVTGIENTANGIKLLWDTADCATGYRIFRKTYSSDNWGQIASVTGYSTSYYVDTATKNQNGPVYQYRIVAYNSTGTSGYSNTKSIARLPSPTIEKLYAGNNHNAVVQWTENPKVSGYELKWRTGSDTQKIVIGGSENFKKTITALSKGKTYAVQVRSFKSANGNRYYSGWSGARNVTSN